VSAPKRIRISRQKPWRKDNPNAVKVDRSTPWGNPFRIDGEYVCTEFMGGDIGVLTIASNVEAAGAFNSWLRGEFFVEEFRARREWILAHLDELAGKDVACWCAVGLNADGYEQCHGGVYLILANT